MHKKLLLLPILTLILACNHKNVNLQDNHNTATDTVNKSATSSNLLIIPGESIGHIHINEGLDTVMNKLGRPDFTDAAMGSAFNTWYSNHDTTGYQIDVYSHHNYGAKDEAISHVKLIRATSPAFKTAQRLNTGRSLQEITKYYHLKHIADYTTRADTLKIYDDVARGIAFEVMKNTCTGILIHAPNDSTSGYISMYPKMHRIK